MLLRAQRRFLEEMLVAPTSLSGFNWFSKRSMASIFDSRRKKIQEERKAIKYRKRLHAPSPGHDKELPSEFSFSFLKVVPF